LRPWKFEAASRSSLIHVSAADAMPAPETCRFFTHFRELNHSSQLFRRLMMETKTTKLEVLETSAAALPTTFVSAEEGAPLAKMLEL